MTLEEVKEWFETRQLEVGIALVGLILIGVGVFWWKTGGGETDKVQILSATDTASTSSLTVDQLAVDVEGAVKNPGVYKLPLGSRVEEAIVIAGGITSDANTKWIEMNLNRAGKLTDGTKIYIPHESETSNSKSSTSTSGTNSSVQVPKLVNINNASQAELEELPGIGPVTAAKIIGGRLYGSINELLSRKIVGQKVYDQIKDLISL